ncbi:MAG: substrate-binding domain-containing protein [Marmoricola sp.]
MRRSMVRNTLTGCAAIGLSVALAACGGGGGSAGSKTVGGVAGGSSKVACGSDGQYLIGMSQANNAEPYRAQMNKDIKRFADKVPQFDVEFSDAAADNSKQVSQVNSYITKQVDLLIISPNEAAPLTNVVAKAYNAGIPVLVLDRSVNGKAFTSFIAADNTKMGFQAGTYIKDKLLPNGGNVVEMYGLPGSPPAAERDQGFRKAIAGTNIKVVAKATADWLRDEAEQRMDAVLKANPNIDVVYSENDPMAQGAYLAAKRAGKAGQIKFTGMDGLAIPGGGLVSVLKGQQAFTVPYPTNGEEAIDAAKKILLQCKSVPKKMVLDTQVVDKSNAAEYYKQHSGGQKPPVG